MLKSAAKQKMAPLQDFLNMPVTTWPTITSQGLSPLNVVICPQNIWTFVWLGYMVFVFWKCLMTFVLNSSQLLRILPFMTLGEIGGVISIYVWGDTRNPICLLFGVWEQKTFYCQVMNLYSCLTCVCSLTAFFPYIIHKKSSLMTSHTLWYHSSALHNQHYTDVDTATSHYISARQV